MAGNQAGSGFIFVLLGNVHAILRPKDSAFSCREKRRFFGGDSCHQVVAMLSRFRDATAKRWVSDWREFRGQDGLDTFASPAGVVRNSSTVSTRRGQ